MPDFIDEYLASPGIQCEGRVNHMYLDTAGLVTTGVGCMIPSAATAALMPFYRYVTNALATREAIIAEYNRIQAMPKGHVSGFYRGELILRDDCIDGLTRTKCLEFVAGLQRVFRGFDTFPRPAQLALLDMAFNLGIGRAPLGPQPGTGLQSYTRLSISVGTRNWTAAAQQCDRNRTMPAFAARNAWTRAQFLAAAQAA